MFTGITITWRAVVGVKRYQGHGAAHHSMKHKEETKRGTEMAKIIRIKYSYCFSLQIYMAYFFTELSQR